MDIPSVLISDTNGSLAGSFKIHVDNPTISAITDEVKKQDAYSGFR
jgi:hypothetical protein